MEKKVDRIRVLVLGAFALFLGIANVFLFYMHGVGVNYPLFFGLVTLCALALVRVYARHVEPYLYFLVGLVLIFATMVFVRESDFLTFLNVLAPIILSFIPVSAFTGKPLRSYVPESYIKALFVPFRFIGPLFDTIPEILSFGNSLSGHPKAKEIIRGSFMAAVAVVVFGALFASADAVFNTLLSKIFTFKFPPDAVPRFILGAVVTAFFIGAFGFMFRVERKESDELSVPKPRRLGVLETLIVLGSITALFLMFILIQFAHFFGGESHLLATGMTYAEYARSGFVELMIVAALAYLIISVAEKQIVREGESHVGSFRILCGVLVLEVVLILVSAFTRLSLYEDAYGFTTIRLYSHAVMIWLSVALVLLFVSIWTNGKREVFALRAFASLVIFLLAMNVLNPAAFIAKKNLARYAASGEIDAAYLGSLSDDALPYTIQLLDDPKEDVRHAFARSVYWTHDRWMGERTGMDSWQSSHLSSERAKKLLTPYREVLKENKDLPSPYGKSL